MTAHFPFPCRIAAARLAYSVTDGDEDAITLIMNSADSLSALVSCLADPEVGADEELRAALSPDSTVSTLVTVFRPQMIMIYSFFSLSPYPCLSVQIFCGRTS